MRRLAFALVPALFLAVWTRHAPAGNDDAKAVNLDKLNTAADEDDPFLVGDGRSLLYASNKAGTFDVLLSKRAAAGQPWPAGKPYLAEKDADVRGPFLYKGDLYYASNKVPDPLLADAKNFDIFRRPSMLAPIPMLGISEKSDELHPWITPAGREFYFSRKTDEGWELFMARGPAPGPVGDAKSVGFPPGFHHATLSSTGLTMYLQGPLENGRTGIFRSRRTRPGAAWSKPEPMEAVNNNEGKRGDFSPSLSADGRLLFFASDRPGGKGGLDIWYVATSQLK